MPKHLRNDHIFKRPLIWLVSLGLCGMVAYIFLPPNILSDPEKETPLPRGNTEEIIQQPLPKKSIPEKTPPAPPPAEKIETPPNPPVAQTESTTKPPQEQSETTTEPPEIRKFVKNYLEFHDSKNFYKTISQSGLNPTLIEQLESLKKRLSNNKVTRVDLLYANYEINGKFNPKNSKVVAVRIYHGDESTTFFSKNEKQEIFFYDEDGNAPELAMDRFPLASYDRISSPFNPRRRHPITHRIRPHNGTDFKAPYGAPVHSTGDGVVKFAGWQRGYGKVVIIEHADDYETRYAHLSAINTKAGEKVKRGQVVGKLGNTGASTGAHLHYEVRQAGTPYDPMTVKLPSYRPLAENYMYAWRYRCNQQTKAMEEIATTGKTDL